jgi:hypothetical protein
MWTIACDACIIHLPASPLKAGRFVSVNVCSPRRHVLGVYAQKTRAPVGVVSECTSFAVKILWK